MHETITMSYGNIKRAFPKEDVSSPEVMESFERWSLSDHPVSEQYAYHKRFILLMNSQQPPPTSHWIFKDPTHLRHLPNVHQTYPGAKIVWCHRNLEQQIYSSQLGTKIVKRWKADPEMEKLMKTVDVITHMGDYKYDWQNDTILANFLRRAIAYRDSHQEQNLFADVYFEDLLRDPIKVVRILYHKFNLDLTSEHVAAMEHWLAENKREPRDYCLRPYSLGFKDKEEMYAAYEKGVYTNRFPRVK